MTRIFRHIDLKATHDPFIRLKSRRQPNRLTESRRPAIPPHHFDPVRREMPYRPFVGPEWLLRSLAINSQTMIRVAVVRRLVITSGILSPSK